MRKWVLASELEGNTVIRFEINGIIRVSVVYKRDLRSCFSN